MTHSNIIPIIVALVLGAGGMAYLWYLSEVRDPALREAVETYEQCVENTFGMTPTQYRILNNEYPECL
jgi:predicted negative regulator of RcsB-dependent stress response